jgi:hypothetical protein
MPPSVWQGRKAAYSTQSTLCHHADYASQVWDRERERKVPGRLNQQKKTKEPKKENKDI